MPSTAYGAPRCTPSEHVVDDRDGQEEDAQPGGCPAADHGQHAERERRVGRHRDAPAGRRVARPVERQVDQHGHRHAAHTCQYRQRDALALAQLAHVEFPPGLEADDEEEQRHQSVVDPVAQVLLERPAAERDVEVRRPEGVVGGPRHVGPDQRRDGAAEQEHRAARLGLDECASRAAQAPRPRTAL
jgi:hypothetical protein